MSREKKSLLRENPLAPTLYSGNNNIQSNQYQKLNQNPMEVLKKGIEEQYGIVPEEIRVGKAGTKNIYVPKEGIHKSNEIGIIFSADDTQQALDLIVQQNGGSFEKIKQKKPFFSVHKDNIGRFWDELKLGYELEGNEAVEKFCQTFGVDFNKLYDEQHPSQSQQRCMIL